MAWKEIPGNPYWYWNNDPPADGLTNEAGIRTKGLSQIFSQVRRFDDPEDANRGEISATYWNAKVGVYGVQDAAYYAGLPSETWTPADLGAALALWLDANDAATISLNGSNVSQWNDKSGNGNHVSQDTASSQPLYTASGLNGKSVVTFSGAQLLNSISNTTLGETIAAVSQRSDSLQPVFELIPASGSRGYLGNVSGFQTHNEYRANGGTTITSIFPTTLLNVPALSVGTDRRLTIAIKYAIGHGTPGYAPLTGFISEIVSTTTILSTDDRQKLEGYLAWKWGLEANLPVGHPYKNAAPTTGIGISIPVVMHHRRMMGVS